MDCRTSINCILLLLGLIAVLSTAGCISPELEDPTRSLEETHADQIIAVNILSGLVKNHTAYHSEELRALAESQQILNSSDPLVVFGLREFYSRTPDLNSIVRLNESFTVVAAAPADMEKYVGSSLRDPADADALSRAFTTYPVRILGLDEPVLENNRLMYGTPLKNDTAVTGYLLYFSNSADYFAEMVQQFQNEHHEYRIWVLDESGTLLHASEVTEIGLNVSTKKDSLFGGITERLFREPSGIARYSAAFSGNLTKNTGVAAWNTVQTPAGNITVILTSTCSSTALIPTPAETTALSLQRFVQEAYVYASTIGKETALSEFMNPLGRFTTDTYYISAYDRNGTLLANPYMPANIGRNAVLYLDENGVSTVGMYTTRAGQGGGSVLHVTTNPLTENLSLQMKHSYVLPVDDSWYIVAGEYLGDEPVFTNITEREQVILGLRSLQNLMQTEGKDAVLAAVGHRAVIFDTNGTLVASSVYPSLVGNNFLGETDAYGSSIVRDLIRLAHEGGGRQYVFYEGHMTLAIVVPLNDELFAVSGVILT